MTFNNHEEKSLLKNIVGKGEHAGYQHFLHFPQYFQKTFPSGSLKVVLFGMGRKHYGKKGKCWLPTFSPIPTMFSKRFFFEVVRSQDCAAKD